MKRLLNLLLVIGILAGLSACDSEDESIYILVNPALIEDIVEDFIEDSSYGVEKQVEIATKVANESITHPAEVYQESLVNYYESEYGYYNYDMIYTANQLESGIEFKSSADGEYQTPYLTSDDRVENDWMLMAIDAGSDYYQINGSSTRFGYQYSKTYEDSFSSKIVFTFDNLEVNRVTSRIKKGTIVFTYMGESSYGETYSNSGTVEYSDYVSVLSLNE
ncbi:MAG: hypothetical protein MI866_09600 [Bacteroidales bacterium]|nr:hypothetical protein [Bacteroidales bacterium]